MRSKHTESPFLKTGPNRLQVEFTVLLLLTVVGAGIALLILHASRVPVIASEASAWLGRPSGTYDHASGRKSQVIFVLFCYTAPLGLGLLVSVMHLCLNWLNRRWQQFDQEDDQFKME